LHSFKVTPSGRTGDGGIDFKGYWDLPDRKVPVVGQCKSGSNTLPVKFLREFIGSLSSYPMETLGVLVSASAWSKNMQAQMNKTTRPLILCQLHENQKILIQLAVNFGARKLLPGLLISKQYKENIEQLVLLYDTSQ